MCLYARRVRPARRVHRASAARRCPVRLSPAAFYWWMLFVNGHSLLAVRGDWAVTFIAPALMAFAAAALVDHYGWRRS